MSFFFRDAPCVILVGGAGTRFSNINEPPKQLIKISKRTLLENIILKFVKNKIYNFIFPLGYKKNFFENYFKKKKKINGIKLNIINKPDQKYKNNHINIVLFEAGEKSTKLIRIKKTLIFIKSRYFFVTYGDGLANIDFKKYFSMIKKNKKNIISAKKAKSQYGHLQINNKGEPKALYEKPEMENPINIGYYFFYKNSFEKYFHKKYELEGKFINILIKKKLINVFQHKGYFFIIDKKIYLLKLKKENKKILKNL